NLEFEFRIINPKQGIRWLSDFGMVEYDEDGTARRMIGTIQDITERKTAESQIRESEENFRALIEASTLFTWTVDEAGMGTELFDWFGEMSGRKIESVHDIIEIIHPDDIERVTRAWKEAVENKTVFSDVCRFRSRTGEYR